MEAEARLVYLRPKRLHVFALEELEEVLKALEKSPGEAPGAG